jgi:allantoin racemase
MRIRYILPAPLGRTPAGAAEMARRGTKLAEFASPGTLVDICDVQRGPASIESRFEEYVSIPATAERVLEAAANGIDAVIIGCFGDPGVDAYRELTRMLVVGPAQVSFCAAASLGHRFSIITPTSSLVSSTRNLVEHYGLSGRLASVCSLNTAVLDLGKDRGATVEKVVCVGRAALEQDGADTLVLGCMSLGFLDIAEEVSQILGVPIVNPSRLSLKAAEALVGAALTHSKLAFMQPPKMQSGLVQRASDLIVEHA